MGHEDAETVDQQAKPDTSDKPDKTAEELDIGWGEPPRDPDLVTEEDEHLLRERPPHWE